MLISKDFNLSDHDQIIIRDTDDLTLHEDQILPLNFYLENKDEVNAKFNQVKVWLNGNDDFDALVSELNDIAIAALEFPKFADGRAFSMARLLRDKYEFKGIIRGFGAPIADQAQFMFRVGFDDIEIPSGDDAIAWQSEAGRMSRFYQHLDDKTPEKNRYQVS